MHRHHLETMQTFWSQDTQRYAWGMPNVAFKNVYSNQTWMIFGYLRHGHRLLTHPHMISSWKQLKLAAIWGSQIQIIIFITFYNSSKWYHTVYISILQRTWCQNNVFNLPTFWNKTSTATVIPAAEVAARWVRREVLRPPELPKMSDL